jgi:cytochrome c-type biogenesis protein
MLNSFFLTVNEWIAAGSIIAAVGCFIWGMISLIFSPCHIASIPLIVAYVGGQDRAVNSKSASIFALMFTTGLFITIALIGILCAYLGRILGDVSSYWNIITGCILIWVAIGMLGVDKFRLSGGMFYRLKIKGIFGALVLGLAYGLLSGSCTFGFIAPILAIITVQKKVATGILFILLFAVGHCLPIMVAGSSMAVVRNMMENNAWQGAANIFRRGAGVTIGLLGAYFILSPFINT